MGKAIASGSSDTSSSPNISVPLALAAGSSSRRMRLATVWTIDGFTAPKLGGLELGAITEPSLRDGESPMEGKPLHQILRGHWQLRVGP